MRAYEALTPCLCSDENCESRDITAIAVEPAGLPIPNFLGAVEVWTVSFDQNEIWATTVTQYADSEGEAVRLATNRVLGRTAELVAA